MQVSTTEFEFSHGRKPRGRGHWAFYFGFRGIVGGTVEPAFAPGEMTFTQAKRWAISEAKKSGWTRVVVGP